MNTWETCRKVLCVRADNMGDVIMSGPAMRALKESFRCSITLLTSSMGALIAPCIPYIDHTLVYDLPWVKAESALDGDASIELATTLRGQGFDAAVIFTAYSQSALPAALIAFMAGIPNRLAYCRENPYGLLTHWVPDKEPYDMICHQVERDLNLVRNIGAEIADDRLCIEVSKYAKRSMREKLKPYGVNGRQAFIVVHTGVSEKKREYPPGLWAETLILLQQRFRVPLLLTGSAKERPQAELLQKTSNGSGLAVAGLFNVEEFAALMAEAALVISVNTATVHIAAAVNTPQVVLYALTNPQHTPWKSPAQVLTFPVAEDMRSRNEVVNYVSRRLHLHHHTFPMPQDIVHAAATLLESRYTKQSRSDIAGTF